jgi:FkbM family methyltransferase
MELRHIIRYCEQQVSKRTGWPIHVEYPFDHQRFKVKPHFEPLDLSDKGSRLYPWWIKVESGEWEYEGLKTAYSYARGDVIDVGAWIGPYSLLTSRKAKRVFSFEPDPVAFEELTYNLRLNKITNVHAFRFAVSDSTGSAMLRHDGLGSSESSMLRGSRSISVSTMSLDDTCQEYGIEPTFIKIDVEGAEGLVMRGAQSTIKKFRPTILLEFHRDFMTESEAESNWGIISQGASSIQEIEPGGFMPKFLIKY